MPKSPAIMFRCSEDFRNEFLAKAKIRKTTGQAVLERLAGEWLNDANTAAVPKPEQKLTCPVCESTLYLKTEASTKGLVLECVPGTEQKKSLNSNRVSYPFENEIERRAVEMLVGILRGRSSKIRSAILSNLDAFRAHADSPDPLDAVPIELVSSEEVARVAGDASRMPDKKLARRSSKQAGGGRSH